MSTTRQNLACALATLVLAWSSLASAQPFKDLMVQPPTLDRPQRGSLAGALAKIAFGPGELARGVYSLPLPIALPQERGPLLASVLPSYSSEGGLSEWGLGWNIDLSIRRFRLIGEIDYVADDFTSPWGRLVKGTDGFWYPLGLGQKARATLADDGWTVVLPDGSKFIFSSADAVKTPKGTYEWVLSRVETLAGDITTLSYLRNPSGRPYLERVEYGGRGAERQYALVLRYDVLTGVWPEYRSGVLRVHDRRVREVDAQVRVGGAFATRWLYRLTYKASLSGPAYYLEAVTKVFRSGQEELVSRYTYDQGDALYDTGQFAALPGLDAYLASAGDFGLQPDKAVLTDLDDDGRLDLEHHFAQTTARQTDAGWQVVPAPPRPATAHEWCRPLPALNNKPRSLARFHPLDELRVAVSKYTFSGDKTQLLLCDLAGTPIVSRTLSGNWDLGANTRMVDLDRDLRPDLIRVVHGGYQVMRNTSTTVNPNGLAFTPIASGELLPRFTPNGSWIHDMNGDGIADIVARHTSGLAVWYGVGNFRFVKDAVGLPFISAGGTTLANVQSYEVNFTDLNRDGLTDAVLTSGRFVYPFSNRGGKMVERPIPILATLTWNVGYAVLADLVGNGGLQAAFVTKGKAQVLPLLTASTGFLIRAEDGKGTTVHLDYAYSRPQPGVGSRTPVLHAMRVESSGKDDTVYSYDYAQPKLHTLARSLIGFDRVQRLSPYLVEEVDFRNDDVFASVTLETRTIDERTDDHYRFSLHVYKDEQYKGVPFLRPLAQRSGLRRFEGPDEVVSESKNLTFDRPFCATVIEKSGSTGTLREEVILSEVTALPADLYCMPAFQRLIGEHDDASLDFVHLAEVKRDALGQQTSLIVHGANGPMTTHELIYNDQQRLTELRMPGKGVHRGLYDAQTGLLTAIETPDGQRTSVPERDAYSDALLTLELARGDASKVVEYFRYDGLERYWRSWRDIGGSSESDPLVENAYVYPSASAPGHVRTRSMIAPGKYAEEAAIMTADETAVATALRIPGGWAVSGLVRQRGAVLEQHGYVRDPILGEASGLSGLTYDSLFAAARPLSLTQLNGFGQVTSRVNTVQEGVEQVESHSTELENGLAVTWTVDAGGFISGNALDAQGNLVRAIDENGGVSDFTYDVLGRIVEAKVVGNGRHSVRYDDYGRPRYVEREEIGRYDFNYDPVTGFATTTTMKSRTGRLERSVSWAYDAAGRIVNQTGVLASTGKTRQVTYEYGTTGHETGVIQAVRGPGFEKNFVHDRAGQITSSTTRLLGWRSLEEVREFYADGSMQKLTRRVRDAEGNLLHELREEQVYDSYGRLSAIRMGGQAFATLVYRADGLLDRVDFAGGQTVAFHHDSATRRVMGSWTDAGEWNAGFDFSFDARNQVASETFSFGGSSRQRTYAYDARGALTSSVDAEESYTYAYDPAGLPSLIVDAAGSRSFQRSPTQVKVGGTTYAFDDMGRASKRGSLSFHYGPSGDLEWAIEGNKTHTFVYDENGQRLQKSTNGKPVAGYFGNIYLDEQRFIVPVKLGERMVGAFVNGEFEFLATDPRGTVVGEDGEDLVPSPFGARTQHPDLAAALDFAEKGYDADLGTVRMGVRDYDPAISQFLSPDPTFFADPNQCVKSPLQCNLYGYAGNNPISFADPSGEILWMIVVVGGAYLLVETENPANAPTSPQAVTYDRRTAADDRKTIVVFVASSLVGGQLSAWAGGGLKGILIGGVGGGLADQAISDVVYGDVSSFESYVVSGLVGGAFEIRPIKMIMDGLFPKEARKYRRVPAKTGEWIIGPRGDGYFIPNDPKVRAAMGDNFAVAFRGGNPDFNPWVHQIVVKGKAARMNYKSHTLKGNHSSDFDQADEWLAQQLGHGKDKKIGAAYRTENDLTWHHNEDCVTLQLISTQVHSIPHAGGVSLMKAGKCP